MINLNELWKDFVNAGHETDKGSVHSYIEIYEKILSPYRHTAKKILEIGIFRGASLRLWESYFDGEVHGIDCSDQPHGGMADLRPMIESGEHNIHILDATNESEVEKHFGGMKFDVIIEDSGHRVEDQIALYHIFKNYLADGGIMIIEDIQDPDNTLDAFVDLPMFDVAIDLRGSKGRYDDFLIIFKK